MLTFLLYAAGMMAQPDWGYDPNAYSSEHVVYAGLVDADVTIQVANLSTLEPLSITSAVAWLDQSLERQTLSITSLSVSRERVATKASPLLSGFCITTAWSMLSNPKTAH